MDDAARDHLRSLIARYGRQLIEQPEQLRALLADAAPDAERERSLLIQAVECGAVAALRSASRSDGDAVRVARAIGLFEGVSGVRSDVANWVILSWFHALGNRTERFADVPDVKARPVVPPLPGPPECHAPPTTHTNAKDGATMVWIPPGPFAMGDPDSFLDSNPPHTINLSGFWMYANLVTVAQYEWFSWEMDRAMPPAPDFNPDWIRTDHPIVRVTWDDASAYAEWAGCSLPTEAQWEKAARGTDGRLYPWGNTFDGSKLWCSRSKLYDAGGTCPVGRLGVSPYGCTDMAGNVWQWCEDWYDMDYWKTGRARALDPVNLQVPPGKSPARVVRGGAFGNSMPMYFRASYRNYGPAFYYGNYGFRCAFRTPPALRQ
ncbi:MAG: SUMF1/EgtB/PvdO family nonheme iron enzyme [Armatimonadetes bacterium]|nr:SUMF1/EgtB/PvdO family nonheme iron enzyme [Armatimonadota bacterium]MDE2205621.1 SUMF1/EgtB/PvdO family nonheme iron enzyme [Armatimonadota bacterium]